MPFTLLIDPIHLDLLTREKSTKCRAPSAGQSPGCANSFECDIDAIRAKQITREKIQPESPPDQSAPSHCLLAPKFPRSSGPFITSTYLVQPVAFSTPYPSRFRHPLSTVCASSLCELANTQNTLFGISHEGSHSNFATQFHFDPKLVRDLSIPLSLPMPHAHSSRDRAMTSAPSSQSTTAPSLRPITTQHSSNTNNFGVVTAPDEAIAMMSPTFVPATEAFRGLPPMLSTQHVDVTALAPAHVVIKHLPAKDTKEYVKILLMWSKEVADCQLLPQEPTQMNKNGLRSALVQFNSMAAALEAKTKLDGAEASAGDPRLAVDIVSPRSFDSRSTAEQTPATLSSASSSANSSLPGSRQPSRFNGAFQGLEQLSPTSSAAFPTQEFPDPERSGRYQRIFSPQSPIGNHLSDRSRMTGKALINDDFASEEETSDLLNDVLAYAGTETPPSSASQRRATAPYLNDAMAAMSINTNRAPGPASLPPYINSPPTPIGPLSPSNRAPGPPYGMGGANFQAGRNHFPPVNPADQNPPCNTLYVGNLPMDTSEEELKAMFSKQRGYKRLCFRTKSNGPMCFVEFEDISFATKALNDLYGTPLHNSVKGGIRLSFSKNPLGVRSGQTPGSTPGGMSGMNGMLSGMANGFASASGPPPGLAAPPGLGAGRSNYSLGSAANVPMNGAHAGYQAAAFTNGHSNRPWNSNGHQFPNDANADNGNQPFSPFFPPHMMGR